jgi:hypothetical protein
MERLFVGDIELTSSYSTTGYLSKKDLYEIKEVYELFIKNGRFCKSNFIRCKVEDIIQQLRTKGSLKIVNDDNYTPPKLKLLNKKTNSGVESLSSDQSDINKGPKNKRATEIEKKKTSSTPQKITEVDELETIKVISGLSSEPSMIESPTKSEVSNKKLSSMIESPTKSEVSNKKLSSMIESPTKSEVSNKKLSSMIESPTKSEVVNQNDEPELIQKSHKEIIIQNHPPKISSHTFVNEDSDTEGAYSRPSSPYPGVPIEEVDVSSDDDYEDEDEEIQPDEMHFRIQPPPRPLTPNIPVNIQIKKPPKKLIKTSNQKLIEQLYDLYQTEHKTYVGMLQESMNGNYIHDMDLMSHYYEHEIAKYHYLRSKTTLKRDKLAIEKQKRSMRMDQIEFGY